MASIVGIDLGGSGSIVSTIRKGAVEVILNEASKRKTPSLISFYNGQRYLGEPAVSLETSNFKNTVKDLKRFIGRTFEEAKEEIGRMPNANQFSKCAETGEVQVQVMHNDEAKVFTMKQLLAMQMTGLKLTSEAVTKESTGTGFTVRDVVLSVPPYFTDAARRSVLDSAQIAGLNCLKLINDPAAVCLDYAMWRNAKGAFDGEKPTLVLFVDIGYSDSWACVAKFTKGKCEILGTSWEADLGGRNVDEALVNKFAQEFKEKYKMDCKGNIKSMLKLIKASEKAKQILTPEGSNKAEVFVEYLLEETDFKTLLKLEDLTELMSPLLSKIAPMIQRALSDAKVDAKDLTFVEAVGGSVRMAQFRKAIAMACGLDLSKPGFGVLTTCNTDESVSRGCTLMCALLSPQFKIATSLEIVEKLNYPIQLSWAALDNGNKKDEMATGEESGGAEVEEVKGTSLGLLKRLDDTPKTRRVTFRRNEPFDITAEYDNAEKVLPAFVSSKQLASFRILVPSSTLAKSKIAVHFTHDKNGVFTVTQAQSLQASGEENKVVKTEIPIQETCVWTWTPEQRERMQIVENDLSNADRLLKERADKRNELEEFIYSARSNVDGGSLAPYCTSEEKKQLLAKLDEEQGVMEEDEDSLTLPVLVHKLAQIHTLYDAINNRVLEIEARQVSVNKFNALCQSYLQVVNNVSSEYAHITPEERARVRSMVEEEMAWVQKEQERQAKQPLNKNAVLTAAMVDEHASKIRMECRATVEKPKPKPKPVEVPVKKEETPAPPADENSMEVEGGEEKKAEVKEDIVEDLD